MANQRIVRRKVTIKSPKTAPGFSPRPAPLTRLLLCGFSSWRRQRRSPHDTGSRWRSSHLAARGVLHRIRLCGLPTVRDRAIALSVDWQLVNRTALVVWKLRLTHPGHTHDYEEPAVALFAQLSLRKLGEKGDCRLFVVMGVCPGRVRRSFQTTSAVRLTSCQCAPTRNCSIANGWKTAQANTSTSRVAQWLLANDFPYRAGWRCRRQDENPHRSKRASGRAWRKIQVRFSGI